MPAQAAPEAASDSCNCSGTIIRRTSKAAPAQARPTLSPVNDSAKPRRQATRPTKLHPTPIKQRPRRKRLPSSRCIRTAPPRPVPSSATNKGRSRYSTKTYTALRLPDTALRLALRLDVTNPGRPSILIELTKPPRSEMPKSRSSSHAVAAPASTDSTTQPQCI